MIFVESRDIVYISQRLPRRPDSQLQLSLDANRHASITPNGAEMAPGALKRRTVDLDFYLHRVFRKTSFR